MGDADCDRSYACPRPDRRPPWQARTLAARRSPVVSVFPSSSCLALLVNRGITTALDATTSQLAYFGKVAPIFVARWQSGGMETVWWRLLPRSRRTLTRFSQASLPIEDISISIPNWVFKNLKPRSSWPNACARLDWTMYKRKSVVPG